MTFDEINILNEKAKTRKDGVYSFRGNKWLTKNNMFIAFADYFGNCYLRQGAFNLCIGTCKRYERVDKLKKILRGE